MAAREVLTRSYAIAPGLAENLVWRKDVSELFGHLPRNVFDIWEYGFTEMFNNAIDHSEGANIEITVWKTATDTQVAISDDGVGIFAKLKKEMGLEDERHAILELKKGKLTTDRKNHTGEGIFFTSRMVDQFDIQSGGVWFSHEIGRSYDWVMDQAWTVKPISVKGTKVYLEVASHTSRTKAKVIDEFSVNSQFGFRRTIVPVKLAQYDNDQLVSRSQAKRLLVRVERFAEAYFDFTGVKEIGRPFADQIFRVFQNEHPEMVLQAKYANADVQNVINEVLRERRLEQKERAKIDRLSGSKLK